MARKTNTPNPSTTTDTTPDPRGVGETWESTPQDSAAGGVLSPPESADGGRADEGSSPSVADRARDAREAFARLREAIDEYVGAVRRQMSSLDHTARESIARLDEWLPFLEALGGGQDEAQNGSQPAESEPIVVHPGDTVAVEAAPSGDVVGTGAEVTADVVVHDENGNEVDR